MSTPGMSTRRRNVSDGVMFTSPPLSFLHSEALLETENQEVSTILKPILDVEKGLIKELDGFLCRWDAAALRRRELLHKRWTRSVWRPVQRRLEDHVTSRCYRDTDRLRCLYADYIGHCNAKGFVSLDCYDPQEYDPFFLNNPRTHYHKLKMPALKDPLLHQSQRRTGEKRDVTSCKTGRKYTQGEGRGLPSHRSPTAMESGPRTGPPQTYSSAYRTPISTTRESSVERGSKSSQSRPPMTPYQVKATCIADGKCYQAGCWSSRRS